MGSVGMAYTNGILPKSDEERGGSGATPILVYHLESSFVGFIVREGGGVRGEGGAILGSVAECFLAIRWGMEVCGRFMET